MATEAEHSCDQLLCDVVLTYDKLRQIPKLYAKMLQGINEAAAGKPCSSWPKEFEEKLVDCINFGLDNSFFECVRNVLCEECIAIQWRYYGLL